MGDQIAGAETRLATGQVLQRIFNRNIHKGQTKSNLPMYEDSLAMGVMIKAGNVAYTLDPLGWS